MVAKDFDEYVLLPLGVIVSSELAVKGRGLDIVALHMKDGDVDGLGNVRGIGKAAGQSTTMVFGFGRTLLELRWCFTCPAREDSSCCG